MSSMSNIKSIVLKTSIGSDLRRFSIPLDINMTSLVSLLSNLYALDLAHYKIQYKDEEDDLVWICTDMELVEALRFAMSRSPPILRLYLSENGVTESVVGRSVVDSLVSDLQRIKIDEQVTPSVDEEVQAPLAPHRDIEDDWEMTPSVLKGCGATQEPVTQPTVVYVAGKAYYPTSNPQPRTYGPTKLPKSEHSSSFPPSTLVTPVVVVMPPPSHRQSLSSLTATIAESISNVVLESSALTHKRSCDASDAILRDTLSASQVTKEEANTQMHIASAATRSHVNRETECARSSVHMNAEAAKTSVTPVSAQTRSLQDEATKGLNESVSRGADAILLEIMNL